MHFMSGNELREKELRYLVDLENLSKGKTNIEIKDNTANPAPLGLLGFGLTTFLLNVHNAGGYEMNSMVLAMGLVYGGAAQIVAGVFEWKKNNLFGFIAFLSYGFFWWSLVFLVVLPKTGLTIAADGNAMGCYTLIWGVFTLGMFVATLKKSPLILVFLFFTVVVLFGLLSIYYFSGRVKVLRVAGVEGIICGLTAVYTAFAEILNEVYGRTMLPMGKRPLWGSSN